MVKIIIK